MFASMLFLITPCHSSNLEAMEVMGKMSIYVAGLTKGNTFPERL